MQSEQQRFKVPVFGWILGGLVLVAIVLLILPSRSQQAVILARKKLETTYACPESIKSKFENGEFFESPISGPAPSCRVITFFNPSKLSPLSKTDFHFRLLNPTMSGLGRKPNYLTNEFYDYAMVVAPQDNTEDQDWMAKALICWIADETKGKQLDEWRQNYMNTSSRPATIAHIKRALAKENKETLKRIEQTIANNRTQVAGIPVGAKLYVDNKNRMFLVTDAYDYEFQNTWRTMYGLKR